MVHKSTFNENVEQLFILKKSRMAPDRTGAESGGYWASGNAGSGVPAQHAWIWNVYDSGRIRIVIDHSGVHTTRDPNAFDDSYNFISYLPVLSMLS
jgi:hypothetical protein